MKRITLFVAGLLIALPLSSFALGFVNISNVVVTQLDDQTYRLRAAVDWGGPIIESEFIDVPSYATSVSDARVNLSAFVLAGPADAFNFFAAVDENIWGAGAESYWEGGDDTRFEFWQPLEHEFGFDFTSIGGLPESMHLDFRGELEWAYTYRYTSAKGSFSMYDIAYYESIGGSYDVRLISPIPVPATLLLFGTGVLGMVVVRRRRS